MVVLLAQIQIKREIVEKERSNKEVFRDTFFYEIDLSNNQKVVEIILYIVKKLKHIINN